MSIIDGKGLRKILSGVYFNLDNHKQELNSLNVFPVPDGDTGTNMSLTLKSAYNNLKSIDSDDLGEIIKAFSNGSLMGARGNSGVITSQILRGVSQGVADNKSIDVIVLKDIMVSACKVAYNAVMQPTEGTILTVIRGAAEFAEENYQNYTDVNEFFKDITAEASRVLDTTPDLLPVLKQAGVVDAGGRGLVVMMEGALNYNNLSNYDEKEEVVVKAPDHNHQSEVSGDIKFGYCTEFLIESKNGDYLQFRNTISSLGDCLIVVGGEGLIKTHIHTNNPGKVLEEALKLGQLKDIKIDNMRIQHSHVVMGHEADVYLDPYNDPDETKKYGFVSISTGDGFEKIFEELGVDQIISGGQTMNPSTETILDAVKKINATDIFILPNNGNIILAAEQAKELSEKNLHILKTKTVPQGVVALLSFDEDNSVEENFEDMTEALESVKTAQVTFSVRDTEMDGLKIKKNDFIGIEGGKILSTGKKLNKTTLDLLDKVIDEDASLVTVYYGSDVEDKIINELERKLQRIYKDIDIEFIRGGQPLYHYIISVE
ncbi:DAK2 domain-containing protein [Lagierella massiliensis]|uniref:DAK2 domain-containing protein n=1 Tax=Lagierella massiliensis TaxID=1689303 RepID=UPI0006D847DE|nr:DAK2 domain-containing protein [Lagierella massiliensis]